MYPPHKHRLTHQYQPTSTSCSPTALAMLVAGYGLNLSPQEIMADVPQIKDEQGADRGTINIQLATWCISKGFRVSLYTFDCQVIDQGWSKLSRPALLERLRASLMGPPIPGIGPEWSKAYRQAYIDFLSSGGELFIAPYATSRMICDSLAVGPLLACVSFSTLHGLGKIRIIDEGDLVFDDVQGRAINHSVVIYANNSDGSLMVADPWQKPGLFTIEADCMIAALAAAQLECDSMFFSISPR